MRGVVDRVEGYDEVGGHPFRLARVQVVETLAGRAPAVVHVRLPGGADAAGREVAVAGVPDLAVDDEVVLFLSPVPRAALALPTRPAGAVQASRRGRAEPATEPPPAAQWFTVSLAVGSYRVVRENGAALAIQDEGASDTRQVGTAEGPKAAPRLLDLADLAAAVHARRTRAPRP